MREIPGESRDTHPLPPSNSGKIVAPSNFTDRVNEFWLGTSACTGTLPPDLISIPDVQAVPQRDLDKFSNVTIVFQGRAVGGGHSLVPADPPWEIVTRAMSSPPPTLTPDPCP